jgi:hypothetical protein
LNLWLWNQDSSELNSICQGFWLLTLQALCSAPSLPVGTISQPHVLCNPVSQRASNISELQGDTHGFGQMFSDPEHCDFLIVTNKSPGLVKFSRFYFTFHFSLNKPVPVFTTFNSLLVLFSIYLVLKLLGRKRQGSIVERGYTDLSSMYVQV